MIFPYKGGRVDVKKPDIEGRFPSGIRFFSIMEILGKPRR